MNDYLVIQPPAFLDVSDLFSRTLSVHSPYVMKTLQLPCHCPFWDNGMPQCHVEILHYQSFWRRSALCLPIRYSEHCQEYPPLQDTLFWNTGRLPSTVFPHQPIIFDNNELACITTLFSDPSWLNFLFNWRTWTRISLFADSTLLWSDSRIVMSSFLFNLSNASSV